MHNSALLVLVHELAKPIAAVVVVAVDYPQGRTRARLPSVSAAGHEGSAVHYGCC